MAMNNFQHFVQKLFKAICQFIVGYIISLVVEFSFQHFNFLLSLQVHRCTGGGAGGGGGTSCTASKDLKKLDHKNAINYK
jgi:hypothetical protein